MIQRRAASGGCKKVIRIGGSKRDLGLDGVCSRLASQKGLPSSVGSESRMIRRPTPLKLFVQWAIHHNAKKNQIYARQTNAETKRKRRKQKVSCRSPRNYQTTSSVVRQRGLITYRPDIGFLAWAQYTLIDLISICKRSQLHKANIRLYQGLPPTASVILEDHS